MLCFICKCDFTNNTELIDHIRSVHPGEKVFRCAEEFCSRAYAIFRSFKRHRYNVHSSQKSPISRKIKSISQSRDFNTGSSLSNVKLYVSDDTNSTNFCRQIATDEVNIVQSEFSNEQCNEIFDDITIKMSNQPGSTMMKYPNQRSPLTNLPENIKSYELELLIFFSRLYDMSEIPRIKVIQIITHFSKIFKLSFGILENYLQQLQLENVSSEKFRFILNTIKQFTTSLEKYETERRCFNEFEKSDTFISPETCKIGERKEYQMQNDTVIYKTIPVFVQFIPISKVLKAFFELPDIFSRTLNYIKELEDNANKIKYNFMQGSLWESKKMLFGDKIVFPIAIYYDDYESNNPLGSHKGIAKCGAVYLSVLCLPPEFRSKLDNIFLFILFNTLDRETFTNESIFYKAVDELCLLQQQGIEIHHNGQINRVYFSLELILGDNLGLHSILGFSESFHANYFCRFCLTHQNNIKKVLHERDCKLRDNKTHNIHIKQCNISKNGVKESCIFNSVPGYDLFQNMSVDVQHDFLEGIIPYDCALLINHFINIEKKFTLTQLNILIQSFPFDKNEKNKPVEISQIHLKHKRLQMSSAEMLTFVNYLGLIIGHLIDRENKYWNLYLVLKRIISIVTATAIHVNEHDLLATEIEEYLHLRVELFSENLKFKHHIAIHYPERMRLLGPLWNISSIRFESKHREGKIIAHSAISRVNICYTVALRHQLKLSHRLLTKKVTCAPYEISSKHTENIANIPYLSHKIDSSFGVVQTLKWIKRGDCNIERNTILMIPSENGPIFHKVTDLILQSNENILILTENLNSCYLDEHYEAYEIIDSQDFHRDCIQLQQILSHTVVITCQIKSSNGHKYIPKLWI